MANSEWVIMKEKSVNSRKTPVKKGAITDGSCIENWNYLKNISQTELHLPAGLQIRTFNKGFL